MTSMSSTTCGRRSFTAVRCRRRRYRLIPDQPHEFDSAGLQLDLAVDRLRDLVRRALVARMCLADGKEPLWPLGGDGGPNVDAVLVDDELRVVWRTAWHDRLAELGAEEAGRPSAPAISWLQDDRDR